MLNIRGKGLVVNEGMRHRNTIGVVWGGLYGSIPKFPTQHQLATSSMCKASKSSRLSGFVATVPTFVQPSVGRQVLQVLPQ